MRKTLWAIVSCVVLLGAGGSPVLAEESVDELKKQLDDAKQLILMLEKGQVIEQGKHKELMEKHGMYYQIYQSQLMSQEENHTEGQ